MMRVKWWVRLIGLVVLVWVVGACGAEPAVPEGTAPAATATSAGQSSNAAATAVSPPPTPAGEAEPGEEVGTRQVKLGDGELSLEVPGSWERLEPEWVWSPDGVSEVRVGVKWADVAPPMEAEAVMLPQNAQVLNAQEIALAWGSARQFDVEVYGQPVGEGERGPVASVQRHVLIVVNAGGVRRAYDLYAEAPTPEALAPLLPVLDQMVASAEAPPAGEEGAAAPSMPALETPEVTPNLPQQPEAQAVQIFFSNTALDPNVQDCSAVYPVERQVPAAANRLDAALNELFAGPTAAEQAEGYTSWFSLDTANILLDAFVEGDTAYVNLADLRPLIPSASSSCGSAQLLAEIGQTVQAAAPGVARVVYAIEGQPRPFYEWLQLGCGETNDFCDPAPFQRE